MKAPKRSTEKKPAAKHQANSAAPGEVLVAALLVANPRAAAVINRVPANARPVLTNCTPHMLTTLKQLGAMATAAEAGDVEACAEAMRAIVAANELMIPELIRAVGRDGFSPEALLAALAPLELASAELFTMAPAQA